MQVDVSVQDCFHQANLSEGSTAERQPADCLSSWTADISEEVWQTWFYQWFEVLNPHLPVAQAYEVTLRLTGDREVQRLNAQYRHQNRPTDVLAFAALELDYPCPQELRTQLPLYLGDIVISVETAQRQAQQGGHSLQYELAWLTAHGLLHLLGWDHPDERSLAGMLSQQTILLQHISIH